MAEPPAAPLPLAPDRGVPRSPLRHGKLLISALAVALVFGYLVLIGMRTAMVYYVTPGELRAQGADAADRFVRVGGRVVDDSIERGDRGRTLRFVLSDGADSVRVVYQGLVPDLFGYARDGYYQDVIVEGRYTRGGVLEARQLIVSHGAAMEAAGRGGSDCRT